ncbi:MAG: germination protein YpeB [Clostridia bacterium]|nr:germination protein YpeB [Clostridia bacterium]
MKKFLKENIKTVILIVLFLLMLITGYYAYTLREQYINTRLNTYNEAFSNVVNYVNNVENYLAKAMISKSPEYSADTLVQIWRDSSLANSYLAQIPLTNETLMQTSKFLNQVSDYSYTMSKKNIRQERLTDEDFENLQTLHKYSLELENTLNTLGNELNSKEWSWNNIKPVNQFAQAVSNVDMFGNIDSNLNEYEGLIYDGAYSNHVEKADKKGLTGEDIDEEKAKQIAKDFFDGEVNEVISNFIEKASIPYYDISIDYKNKQAASIAVSKKGGHVIYASLNRDVKEDKLSEAEADKKGKEFLDKKGFKNMRETYYIKEGNIVTVNYAYEQNGTIIYPDLIKVKIALDNGDILGIETTGYLNSHTERKLEEAKITLEEAKEKINDKLKITSERKAIIPTKWKTEILCYEFQGKVDDKEFLVYVNVKTGKEENILVILETPGGTLTM